jgi:hypothetical protein
MTPATQTFEDRMANAWIASGFPVVECGGCGRLSDTGEAECTECRTRAIRPAMTMACLVGLAMLAK